MPSLIENVKALVNQVTPIIESQDIPEDQAEELTATMAALQESLNQTRPLLADVERKEITSFEDWDDRVYSVVEFVRPDDTVAQFKIHSLTATELKEMRIRLEQTAPIQPEPRSKSNGAPDLNDKHYIKAMQEYENDKREHDNLNILMVLEAGLDFKIPGDTDADKLAAIEHKVAGDAAKIAAQITDISNLNPEMVRPF